MIISGESYNKMYIRNRKDFSIIKIVKHHYWGYLFSGLCYPLQKVIVLGIGKYLIEFDYENMKIMKDAKTENSVCHILKVNDETFLIHESFRIIKLIRKNDLTCLSHLKLWTDIS